MRPQPEYRWDRETTLVSQIAAGVSLLAFLFYFRRGDLLLYGDAVAHINIARRVFDSQTPGWLQLGTVWLPLPHLLMIPFLISDSAWQTGIGGTVPSVCAYVLGTAGIFRLVRTAWSFRSQPKPEARFAAWLAAAIYAANPNLLYLQTTAMTEALYLALFIWSLVHFSEFAQALDSDTQSAGSSLTKCSWCLAGACLTRYDGWFLAAAIGVAACVVMFRWSEPAKKLRPAFMRFVLLAAAAPVLWLAYNAIIYRNPLEFATGPYSAKAIEQKNATPGEPGHPGSDDLRVAFSYFLKSAELNLAEEAGLQRLWVALLLAGTVILFVFDKDRWPLLMLFVPLPFYILSVAYGGVPIFLPVWWPFSYYNARYGIELLPAFAVFTALIAHFAFRWVQTVPARIAVGLTPIILLVASYALIWRAQPVCYREAWINSRSRVALETELAATLARLPHDSVLLMYLGDHVGALQRAAIPLHRTINEGNHRPWEKPADPNGLWERALADPQRYADYVVAIDNDPVATGVQKRDLSSMVVIRTLGQPPATVYWTHRPLR